MQSVEDALIKDLIEDYMYWVGEGFPKEDSSLSLQFKEILKTNFKIKLLNLVNLSYEKAKNNHLDGS